MNKTANASVPLTRYELQQVLIDMKLNLEDEATN